MRVLKDEILQEYGNGEREKVPVPRNHGDKLIDEWNDSTRLKFGDKGALGLGESCAISIAVFWGNY